jgi:TonB-dependent receptor
MKHSFNQFQTKETENTVLITKSPFWGDLGGLPKQTLFLLFFAVFLGLTPTIRVFSQNKAPNFPKESLQNRIERIIKEGGITISYTAEMVKNIQVSALKSQSTKPEEWLRESLKNTGLSYSLIDGKIFALTKQVKQSIPASSHSSTPGRLSGIVTDEKGEPIIGASVIIPGTGKGTVTDVKGSYTIQAPAGETTIEASFLSYQKKRITGVDIRPDKTTKLDITLSEDNKQLTEVTVTAQVQRASAAGMLLQQKSTISMTDGISADLIKKTSDNNVAQVLKRVAGVTINEGKFVTVRGMSERYNNVQLNGSSLPSTEPNRRNFSFDIIPSTLIDNVTVSKTFTPDLPGEFTGGLVQVKTLSVPEIKFLSISLGTGGNTSSTGKEFQTNKRYAADYLLGELDQRTWYAGSDEANLPQSKTNAGQMNHFGLYKYTAVPLQAYSLSFGLPIKLNEKHSLGLVAALTYRHEETREKIKEVHTFGNDSLISNLGQDYNYSYKFVTALGAVANLGWKTADHAITWRNLLNNRYTTTTTQRIMHDYYDMKTQFEVYSAPLQARLTQTQLDGEHAFFGKRLTFTWNADYNSTSRISPDDRFALADFQYDALTGLVVPSADGKYKMNWGLIGPSYPYVPTQFVMYSGLEETKKNAGANAEYKFNLLQQAQKLKAGYLHSYRKAEYDQLYLHAYVGTAGIGSITGASLHEFYDPANFTNGLLYYKQGGFIDRSGDAYTGKQTLDAAYLMADISLVKSLHIIGGVRMENAVTKTNTFYSWYDSNGHFQFQDSTFTRNNLDWLPSVTAIYAFNPKLNLRAAYSKTLARPDFRELTNCQYYNVSDRTQVINETAIEQSSTKNYDLRLEWYPSAGEVISLSAFYKDFYKPVEKMTRVRSDAQNFDLLTVNLDGAIVKGLELNFRKSFAFAAPVLKDLWLSGNATILKGNVESKTWGRKRERPLQGLAPYNVNGSLTYEVNRWGAAVNYTRVGRTLVIGGEFAKNDFYENPRNVLDLQLSARFLKQRMELKFNVSDLLNEDVIIYSNCGYTGGGTSDDVGTYSDRTALGMDYNPGDRVTSRTNKGVNYSLSVSYKF